MRGLIGLGLLWGGVAWAQPALLQAGEKQAISEALGLEAFDEMPAYVLDLSLSDRSGHFEGRGTLTWTNRTGRSQKVLPLLLHTNSQSQADMRQKGGMRVTSVRTIRGPHGEAESPRPSLVNYVLKKPLAVGEAIKLEFGWEGWLRNLGDDDNDL